MDDLESGGGAGGELTGELLATWVRVFQFLDMCVMHMITMNEPSNQ